MRAEWPRRAADARACRRKPAGPHRRARSRYQRAPGVVPARRVPVRRQLGGAAPRGPRRPGRRRAGHPRRPRCSVDPSARSAAVTGGRGAAPWPLDERLAFVEAQQASSGFGDDWLRLDGLKPILDGGISAAAMDEPYADEPAYRGELKWDRDELAEVVEFAVGRGWRVATHVCGDRAVPPARTRRARGITEGHISRHR